MSAWNFADVWETVAELLPDAPALTHGPRTQTWSEVNRRADAFASGLLDLGLGKQDKVAHYLYNCSEYLESMFAIFKASLVPVNTNYRYASEELAYLWDNADAAAVIFHGVFSSKIEPLLAHLDGVRAWLWIDDGSGPCPSWARPYEQLAGAEAPPGGTVPPWGRGADDLYILYTGGTTGYPKGVMWRQDDLFAAINAAAPIRYPEEEGLQGVRDMLTQQATTFVPACPLMHGTGAITAFSAMSTGACVVTLTERHFDAVELLDTIESQTVSVISLVGDAFVKPMLQQLDANPGRWDLSSLAMVISSGVMWSEEIKAALHRHNPAMLLVDAFGSSEALGMGASVSTSGSEARTARFALGERARVIDEDGHDVEPGSGIAGRIAVAGRVPIGYYKDRAKTATTFPVIDGVRYSVPGDFATIESDGSLHLLGRGSVVINTGGEKVYPEEVEEVLKTHPAVADTVVVGIPDDRFGQAVCALVQLRAGASVSADALVAHVRTRLAGFKIPRRVVVVDDVMRTPSGKVDYAALASLATRELGKAPG